MTLVAVVGTVALALLSVALIIACFRLFKGPGLADRVIALDMIAALSIMIMGCLSVTTDNPVLLDACLSIALLAFVSTVAFARYMERKP